MSEYQYYEFRAVDRPLTGAEMKRLRALSTRADITPVSFVNHYEWGDFKGDPTKLMRQYFDGFLYLANWGTRRLMFRVPVDGIDRKAAKAYCTDDSLTLEVKGKHALLEFWSEEEGGDWDESGEGLLERMLPLREAVVSGDLLPLYVGWLAGLAEGSVDEDAPEPPVPAGLRNRSPALNALARFLRVSDDLLTVAAAASPEAPAAAGPTRDELAAKVAALPEADRNALLVDLAEGVPGEAKRELHRRLRELDGPARAAPVAPGARAAGQLLAAAEARAEKRLRKKAEQAARERARLEAEAAAKRITYLQKLSERQDDAWQLIESKVDSKQKAGYDEAVDLLKDLRDLGLRDGAMRSFEARVRALQARHAKKSTFVERLHKAGLLKWGGAG